MSDLAREAGIDAGTAADFLKGTRWPNIRTQGQIEESLGWPPGTVAAVVDGAEPPPLPGVDADDDPDAIHLQRPDDLTDQEWKHLRHTTEEFIAFTLDRTRRNH